MTLVVHFNIICKIFILTMHIPDTFAIYPMEKVLIFEFIPSVNFVLAGKRTKLEEHIKKYGHIKLNNLAKNVLGSKKLNFRDFLAESFGLAANLFLFFSAHLLLV